MTCERAWRRAATCLPASLFALSTALSSLLPSRASLCVCVTHAAALPHMLRAVGGRLSRTRTVMSAAAAHTDSGVGAALQDVSGWRGGWCRGGRM